MSRDTKPLVERAGLAAFWNAAFFPLKTLVALAASIIAVRLLRTEGWALYLIVTSLLNGFGLIVDLGIERALPRFYPEVEMRYGRRGILRLLFWVSVVKGAVLLVLLLALAVAPDFWITQFNLGEQGGFFLLMIGVLLVLGALSDISIQLLYTHFRQKVTNSLDVIASVVFPVLSSLFVYIGWGAVGMMLALLITTVISVALSVWQAWLMMAALDPEPHPKAADVKRPSTRSLRDRMIGFAGLNYLINWTVNLYDLPFFTILLTLIVLDESTRLVQIAILGLAFRFTRQFLRALVVPLTGVQTPLFARLYAEGRMDGLRTAYATLTKFLILALLPAGVGLILSARNLLTIMFVQVGEDAVLTQPKLPDAVACTAILTIGLFGEAIISVVLNVLMVHEDYGAVITARLVALASIPVALALVPLIGVTGAAIAAAVAALGSRLVALGYAVRRVGLRFPGEFFVRVGLASSVMGVALLPFVAFLPPTPLPTVAMIVTGAVVFYLMFRLMGGMDQEDKQRFSSLRVPFANVVLRYL
ncbi:MAG TPA: oligosaccharide flippase family protein [Chloroflexia bacterium]